MVYLSQLRRECGKFCSWKCYQNFIERKVKRVCLICNKDFYVKPSVVKKGQGSFCSQECWLKFIRGSSIKTCEVCGKKFKSCPSRLEKGWGKYCSKKCMGKAKTGQYFGNYGDKHPNWRGGTSEEPYAFEFSKQLKELIRHRDGYKCQKCGCPEIENNKKLTCHHIDYDKKNCLPINLISLCSSCNSKVNFNRSKWTKYFQKKIDKIMNSNAIQLNFRYKDNKTKQSIRR